MGLLNYTTSIHADKTVAEIQRILVNAKANAVLCEYDGSGNVVALSFKAMTPFGELSFRMPADPQPVLAVLNQQVKEGKIPRRYQHDVDQARRVAWRIVKDWIEAQAALIQTRMVTIEQVFLPYAQNSQGETLYEAFKGRRFDGLALPSASNTE
jgi:hypothetical protein